MPVKEEHRLKKSKEQKIKSLNPGDEDLDRSSPELWKYLSTLKYIHPDIKRSSTQYHAPIMHSVANLCMQSILYLYSRVQVPQISIPGLSWQSSSIQKTPQYAIFHQEVLKSYQYRAFCSHPLLFLSPILDFGFVGFMVDEASLLCPPASWATFRASNVPSLYPPVVAWR